MTTVDKILSQLEATLANLEESLSMTQTSNTKELLVRAMMQFQNLKMQIDTERRSHMHTSHINRRELFTALNAATLVFEGHR